MLQVVENDSKTCNFCRNTCCVDSSPVRHVTRYRFVAHNVALKIRVKNLDDCVLTIAVEDCHCFGKDSLKN